MNLQGKTAIVAGGGRGLGRAVCLELARGGADIVLCYAGGETTARQTAGACEARGVRAAAVRCDVSEPGQVARLAETALHEFGRIDILVNNAWISQSTPLYDYTAQEFDQVIDLNVKAVFYAILPAAKIMKEQGGGCIINTSSMVAEYGQPAGCGYPATKFAVNGLTRSLARELAKDHIRVNAVAPGVTRTDMVAALPPEMVERISSGIPLGRVGEPEDIANAFLYLASSQASYVTGVTLRVDGAAMT